MPKNNLPEAGTRKWHEKQVIECLGVAQRLTEKVSNVHNTPEIEAMQAVQITCQAMVHSLMMLNPDLLSDEEDE